MTAPSEVKCIDEKKTCEIHGEYISRRINFGGRPVGGNRCPECDRIDEKAKADAKAKIEAERAAARIEAAREKSNVPKRFQSARIDGYKVENDGQAKAVAVCKAYIADLGAVFKNGSGLIFSGKAGTGKSHLACAIIDAVISSDRRAKFYTVAAMMRKIKSSFSKDAEYTEQEIIDHFSEVDLLVLDEVGMDYGTDFNKSLMFEVLNKRYENVLPTIILTNLDAPALREYMGDRLLDRMREGGGKLVSFTWDSQRGKA